MATCKNCNASVGCGCQLKNGLCASCYSILNKLKYFFKLC
jgi:hypothetical protein